MAENALVAEHKEAGRKFLMEFTKSFPVDVAFWLRNDEGRLLLYVASHQITGENIGAAYLDVHQIARRLRDPWLDSMDIRVINSEDRLAKAALQVQSNYGPDVPGRFTGDFFGGVNVEEVYVYPTPVPAS